jgi:hypothetical protein
VPKKTKEAKTDGGDERFRDWLQPDGTCLICERDEGDHDLDARRQCIAEYRKLADEFTHEQGKEETMAKKKEAATKRKAPSGGRQGAMLDGHSTTDLMEAAKGGKTITLNFKSPTDAKNAAYTLWGLRRRRGLQASVAISLDREDKTVVVGPADSKPKKAKKAKASDDDAPAKKVKKTKKVKASDDDAPAKKTKKGKKKKRRIVSDEGD